MKLKDVSFQRSLLRMALFAFAAVPVLAHADATTVGAVYAMTNAAGANDVVVYPRASDGTLGAGTSYATGGAGLGASLGSQGSLKLSTDGRWLFAVNAGSNELSVFATSRLGLVLTDKVASGGTEPVSVAVSGDVVYVLNTGSDSVSGFTIDLNGKLTPIAGSAHALGGTGTGAAEIAFSPDGSTLVATEKATSQILVFPVGDDNLLGAPTLIPSATPTPFGFAFGRFGEFFVSEANPGQAGLSTLASLRIEPNGGARVQNPSAATYQSAACWVAVSHSGRYVYTANPASDSLSAFRVGPNGSLTLLNADGVAGTTGAGALDLAIDRGSGHLYSINPGNSTISAWSIGSDGALTPVATLTTSLPASAYGLAAQ